MAKVDGQVVRVGDVVCFKSDYEQTGRIVAIKQSIMGSDVLVLESADAEGFGGDYIGGQDRTQEMASDCWIE
jgi:hypothetical protein